MILKGNRETGKPCNYRQICCHIFRITTIPAYYVGYSMINEQKNEA